MHNTTLALVWHMHQPYYRDMITGESSMPWVRLHGIHSYYDMLRLYRAFPKMHGTINFVPSLIEQLLAYTEGGKSDAFLDHTRIPAKDLTTAQKAFLLRHFFMASYERKIAPHGPYAKLHARLGLDRGAIDYNQAVRFFSTQDYLDLQVYYNLVWFGFAAREEIPELDRLFASGGHFTEENKAFVLDAQFRILRSLLEELRTTAASSENVEITTTPYYHPILPLLLDTDIARRANPKAPLPPRLRLPQIAKAQVDRAMASMERWTGRRPRGMWPAEGSVCPEMIPLLVEAGVRWIATDDRVLGRSLSSEDRAISMHQPFAAMFDGATIGIVFRDHGLSDLISFTYSRMPTAAAVADFIGHLKEIASAAKGAPRLVTVILDGENPWEFYPQDGKEFLTELFVALDREGIPTTAVGNYLERTPPAKVLDRLHSGSWIDANFNIWIGKPQKNTGWNYIKRTADELAEALQSEQRAKDPRAALAFDSLCAACGSDWFWWYDDDFESAFKADFDRIFRGHLKNVFTLLSVDTPLFLFEPIYRFEAPAETLVEPPGCIEPTIDGVESSFFEWSNASFIDVRGRSTGAMAMASADLFEGVYFGFNEGALYLRIDPLDPKAGFRLGDEELSITIYDGKGRFKMRFTEEGERLVLAVKGDEGMPQEPSAVTFAAKDVLEIAVPFAPLSLAAGDRATVVIALRRQGVEIRRYSHIHFVVPDDTYRLRMWTV
jgi:alpha-amylase/alpha-mannosidase (GH57 family)